MQVLERQKLSFGLVSRADFLRDDPAQTTRAELPPWMRRATSERASCIASPNIQTPPEPIRAQHQSESTSARREEGGHHRAGPPLKIKSYAKGQWSAACWCPPANPASSAKKGAVPRGEGRMPPPEECQLFNMETAVTTLETMFQKAESDLDYIQTTLEFEMMKQLPNGLAKEENPLVLIQQLTVVKSRYKSLCEQLEKISAEQQESTRVVRATLAKTMRLVQEIQQQTGTEISPLSEEEQRAMQRLMYQTPENCPKEH
ncbi:spindle and kinetochore-associated protein 2 [Crotalus adamanteus]|uniref:Protein FAM33A n=1 Tax=Crotalus adamanteus TaxID=8729 RepID=A0AAW1CDV0_CROAD